MSDLNVSFAWSIVKTPYNRWNCFLAYKMPIKITYFFVKIPQN